MFSRSETRTLRLAPEARRAAAVTELLPNLKMSTPPKMVDALKARTHTVLKAIWRQKPCVVMKRTDSIYPVQLRSGTEEFRGWMKHRCYTAMGLRWRSSANHRMIVISCKFIKRGKVGCFTECP